MEIPRVSVATENAVTDFAVLPPNMSYRPVSYRPVRSGFLSAVLGAGAVRFGFPSAVRGIPGVG